VIDLLRRSPSTHFATGIASQVGSTGEVKTGGHDFTADGLFLRLAAIIIVLIDGSGGISIGFGAVYPNRADDWGSSLIAGAGKYEIGFHCWCSWREFWGMGPFAWYYLVCTVSWHIPLSAFMVKIKS